MHHHHLQFRTGFHLLCGDAHSQAAQMSLEPGAVEGGPENSHQGSDQWLHVVRGTGEAVIEGRTLELRPGTIVFIQRGERHEIRNCGRYELQTLNVYVPPAYSADGDELPAGRSRQ